MTAFPASTSSTAAITRAFSSVSPFGHSIGKKRHSAARPAFGLVGGIVVVVAIASR